MIQITPRDIINLPTVGNERRSRTHERIHGYTPLHFLAEGNDKTEGNLKLDLIKSVISYGGRRDLTTSRGHTPYALAYQTGANLACKLALAKWSEV